MEGGYEKLLALLGESAGALVAMEATGHYWKNLFAVLCAKGFTVALVNPLRTSRFAGEDLERTKTDAIDALGIARFAAQKRPAPTRLPEVGILGLHQMKQKPVVKDGRIVIGDVMLLSLSFDHRLIDGHVGAAFAYEIIGLIEDPDRLLLEL